MVHTCAGWQVEGHPRGRPWQAGFGRRTRADDYIAVRTPHSSGKSADVEHLAGG